MGTVSDFLHQLLLNMGYKEPKIHGHIRTCQYDSGPHNLDPYLANKVGHVSVDSDQGNSQIINPNGLVR